LSNAKVILVEDGVEIKTVSGSTSGTGIAVFPLDEVDKAKKYEVYDAELQPTEYEG
jgi:hypothetical protein